MDEFLAICAKYTGMGYYVINIPDHKLRNALVSFKIPDDETVIALIDCTLSGSCKDGLAICESGIYWHNSWVTRTNITYLSWDEFVNALLVLKDNDLYFFDGAILGAYGYFGEDNILQLLKELQYFLKYQPDEDDVAAPQQGSTKDSSSLVPPPLPVEERWVLAYDGKQLGEFTPLEVIKTVKEQQLDYTRCLVWKPGMDNWTPMPDIPEFSQALSRIPPPLPKI